MEEGSVGGVGQSDDGGDRNSRRQMGLDEEDEEETKCKAAIEVEKRVYKGSFQVGGYRIHGSRAGCKRYQETWPHSTRTRCEVRCSSSYDGAQTITLPKCCCREPNSDTRNAHAFQRGSNRVLSVISISLCMAGVIMGREVPTVAPYLWWLDLVGNIKSLKFVEFICTRYREVATS